MPHDHHRCECKHGRVKFCGKCSVVHCLDCKVEWSHEPCQRSHGVLYPYYSTYTGAASSLAIQAGGQTSLINPTNATIEFTSQECAH